MDEELHYATVMFKSNDVSTQELYANYVENTIYDEVKTEEQTCDGSRPVISESGKTAPPSTALRVVAAGLGILCVILVSVIVVLRIYLNAVISEYHTNYDNLTTQNLQLRTEKTDLERQTDKLSRERDALNWTVGVILEFDNFPVNRLCSQKVCKPCLADWLLFRSSCYLFTGDQYSSSWKTWDESREHCRKMKADLVMVGSQEEQEFINNHTERYNDDAHGYWIGLTNKAKAGQWLWADGSIPTVKYWIVQQVSYWHQCTLILPLKDPLASWSKASCDMRNRWICETKALIKSD
uniref:C-type lectin domain family 7 member A n=1 Tax=Centroberyx gerrardi TaxID=166262 RepID=UPI003AAB8FFC